MIHSDWIPEYVAAFEHYNDLLREAQRERLAHLVPPPPRQQIPWAVDNAVQSAICSLGPLHNTEVCTVPAL